MTTIVACGGSTKMVATTRTFSSSILGALGALGSGTGGTGRLGVSMEHHSWWVTCPHVSLSP